MTTQITSPDTYVTTVYVEELFADPTYQRPVDTARARRMAKDWDRRLAGILEVSDRGDTHTPRYAVIDGQHRWAAAGYVNDGRALVANIHTDLSITDEAKLFDMFNRQRKQVNIWEQWRARAAAGDELVIAVNDILAKYRLKVDTAPKDGCVGCVGALERVAKIDTALLDETLGFITDVWQTRRDGLDAPIIGGLALIFDNLRDELDLERLADTLLDVLPRQLKTQAVALRDMQPGTLPVLTAVVIMGLYNKRPGRKIEVTTRTFTGARQVKGPAGFVARYREMRDELGMADWEIAKRMDINLRSLVRSLRRHNMPVDPLLASMAVEERNQQQERKGAA